MTLRRDSNARFIRVPGGCLTLGFGGRTEFRSGRSFVMLGNREYSRLLTRQWDEPVEIMSDPDRDRTWWMFEDRIYWEDEGYDADEVEALIRAAELRTQRRLEQAMAMASAMEAGISNRRSPIPEEVRLEVWRRDGGQCVKCGSQERLEFDHIIPLAMGGSNTARNVQILCEACNRSKGASLR